MTNEALLPVGSSDGHACQAMETRLRDLSFLYDLTSSLGCTLDLEADLAAFVERLRRLLVVDVAALFVCPEPNDTGQPACVRAAVGIPDQCHGDLRLPNGIANALAVAADPGLCHWSFDADTPERAELDALRQQLNPRLSSLHGIALRLSGRVLGALLVASVRPAPFSERTAGMLRVLVNRATITIDHGSAHTALRASEQKYRTLLMGAADGIVVYDVAQDRVVDVNLAAERLFGLHGAGESSTLLEFFARAAEFPDDEHARCELVVAHGDDGVRTLEARVQSFVMHGAPRLLAVFRDVTARKRLEHDLVVARETALEANRVKSVFLATMSHEIRTPMNGVLGMAQVLQTMELSDEARAMVTTIDASANALLGILNDVLDVAKIEAGHMTLEVVPFDVRAVVGEAVALHREVAARKGVEVEFAVGSDVPATLAGDPLRLRQIASNLVHNAIKFTASGRVDVRVRQVRRLDDAFVLGLEVADTGIGIEPAVAERLFEPFAQADRSTTRRFGGTGLGLAICRQLAKLMSGRIWVESDPGVGATFFVELRLAVASDPPAPGLVLAPLPTVELSVVRGRVLLVEDDVINQRVAQRMLARMDLDVDTADDGAKALEILAHRAYDLVLMDCQMPVLDGYATTIELRRREAELGRAHVKVIGLTANVMPEDRERCAAVGMDGFLAKPVRFDEFTRVVASALARPEGVECDGARTGATVGPGAGARLLRS